MTCDIAREALSARIDGEREPVPAVRVDEHFAGCAPCRQWQAAAVEQTQLLRRLAGRSQLAAVRALPDESPKRLRSTAVSWQRWALGVIGVVQLALAVAQGLGAHLGVPHMAMATHVLNESTAWSAALGVAMVAAAGRPVIAGGLTWVLGAFTAVLSVYVVADAIVGRVTADRVLTHLPLVAGGLLAWIVWGQRRPDGHHPDQTVIAASDEIVLPENASRGRRRGHLRPSDGSAA